jgi:hypothetical protein
MYVVGRIATEELIYVSGILSGGDPKREIIINNILEQNGGVEEDYFIYYIENGSETQVRLFSSDEFDLVWSDVDHGGEVGITHEITDIDFSKEDNKRQIVFIGYDPERPEERKTEFLANGTDGILLKCTVFDPSDPTMQKVDTTYTEEIMVPFTDPDKRLAFSKVQFTNGYSEKVFKTTKYGLWSIPSGFNFEGKNAKTYAGAKYELNALLDI